MDPDDSPRFCLALAKMGVLFNEELSKERQLLYWEALNDEMSIDEWEAVTAQARKRHHYHKVPLPADFIAYAKEARRPKNMAYMG